MHYLQQLEFIRVFLHADAKCVLATDGAFVVCVFYLLEKKHTVPWNREELNRSFCFRLALRADVLFPRMPFIGL